MLVYQHDDDSSCIRITCTPRILGYGVHCDKPRRPEAPNMIIQMAVHLCAPVRVASWCIIIGISSINHTGAFLISKIQDESYFILVLAPCAHFV